MTSKDDKKAFYFHAILKNGNNCKAIIFPVYINELERYIISLLKNTNFNALKRQDTSIYANRIPEKRHPVI